MREQQMARAFVELADSLVDDFDVIDFLDTLAHHCVELLDVDAAGLMLGDQHGRLRHAAASSENARLFELFEIQADVGPCVDCFRSGDPVINTSLSNTRWPHFTDAASAAGFASVHALPLRLRGEVVGALNLLHTAAQRLTEADQHVAQALADISTISILSQRSLQEQETLATQLQNALTSRIVVEQAKGVLAAQLNLAMDEAYEALRDHARSHQQRLSDVARRLTEGNDEVLSAVAHGFSRASAKTPPDAAGTT